MSHYFSKRENDQQNQGNFGSNGSFLQTVVPIFNTKKRRVKQALYSNPSSSQETKNSFSSSTSQLNSGFRSNFTKNSKIEASFPSKPAATTQFKNSTATAVNAQQRPNQFKQGPKKQGANGPRNLPCLPKPRPQFGRGGIALNSGNNGSIKQESTRNKTPAVNINIPTQPKKEVPQFEMQDLKALKSVDKTAKVFTATVKTVMDWEEFREKLPAVFEVYGAMESAVSTNSSGKGKSFMLKDNTGHMRCTFWEMVNIFDCHAVCHTVMKTVDRLLPRMTRGRSYRVVGSLDRCTHVFNCYTVRPANPVEVRLASTSTALSEVTMQSFITTFKED